LEHAAHALISLAGSVPKSGGAVHDGRCGTNAAQYPFRSTKREDGRSAGLRSVWTDRVLQVRGSPRIDSRV